MTNGRLRKTYLWGIIIFTAYFYAVSPLQQILTDFWNTSIFGEKSIFLFSRLLIWLGIGLVLIYVRKIERGHFFLRKERRYPCFKALIKGTALYIAVFSGALLISLLVHAISGNTDLSKKTLILKGIFEEHKLIMIFTAVTAGVTEELFFRGYLQPRISFLTKNATAGIVISALIFGLAHFAYGTALQIIVPVFIGLCFAWFYQKYQNIKILITVHTLYDVLVFINLLNH